MERTGTIPEKVGCASYMLVKGWTQRTKNSGEEEFDEKENGSTFEKAVPGKKTQWSLDRRGGIMVK